MNSDNNVTKLASFLENYQLYEKGNFTKSKILRLTNTLLGIALFTSIFWITEFTAYPHFEVLNYTPADVEVIVKYPGCRSDAFKVRAAKRVANGYIPLIGRASAYRGGCLVSEIFAYATGGSRVPIQPYKSSGAGYSQFHIQAKSAQESAIFSLAEVKRARGRSGMSLGFKIHNPTKLPLTISLEQVGCLYYENRVLPGETMDRDTGAVWFTIKARPSNPNKPINDYDCIIPAEKAVISALAAVATGGDSALSEIAVEWGAKFVAGKEVGKVAQRAYNLVAGNSVAKSMVHMQGRLGHSAVRENRSIRLQVAQYLSP